MITSIEDLSEHVGAFADTMRAISRRVYKDTACGAWVEEVRPFPKKMLSQTWRAKLKLSILGITVYSLGPCRRTVRVPGPQGFLRVPAPVLEYLHLRPGSVRMWLDDNSLENARQCRELWGSLKTDAEQRVTERGGFKYVTFRVDVPSKQLNKGGVRVGSIVEGVEEYAKPQELLFPFAEEDWDAAVQAVEDDTKRIWDETHGCSKCGLEDEFGRAAVNPECESCKGSGVII